MRHTETLMRLGFKLTQHWQAPCGPFWLTAELDGERVEANRLEYGDAVEQLYNEAMGLIRRRPAVGSR